MHCPIINWLVKLPGLAGVIPPQAIPPSLHRQVVRPSPIRDRVLDRVLPELEHRVERQSDHLARRGVVRPSHDRGEGGFHVLEGAKSESAVVELGGLHVEV